MSYLNKVSATPLKYIELEFSNKVFQPEPNYTNTWSTAGLLPDWRTHASKFKKGRAISYAKKGKPGNSSQHVLDLASGKSGCYENIPTKASLVGPLNSWHFQKNKSDNLVMVYLHAYDAYSAMHADVAMEAIINHGLNDDKQFNCDFIWSCISSRTMLVRVDSDLHKAAQEKAEIENKPAVNAYSLEPGDVMLSSKGDAAIFLGFVSNKGLRFKDLKKVRDYTHWRTYVPVSGELKNHTSKAAALWYKINRRLEAKDEAKVQKELKAKVQKELNDFFENQSASSGYAAANKLEVSTKGGHGFVKKADFSVKIPKHATLIAKDIKRSYLLETIEFNKKFNVEKVKKWCEMAKADYAIRPDEHKKGRDNGRSVWFERDRYGYSYSRQQQYDDFSPPDLDKLRELVKLSKESNFYPFGMDPLEVPEKSVIEKVFKLLCDAYSVGVTTQYRMPK